MQYGFSKKELSGVTVLTIPSFEATGLCTAAFTTRLGGISKPPLHSMNLGFGRGDARETVLSNYSRVGQALGIPSDDIIAFCQVHKDNVFVATQSDRGEAFSPNKREYDAIITNEKNLPLATYHADCVPIFLLDPKTHSCGVCHAGWRGTALQIVKRAISSMQVTFGTNPENLLAAIGPAIGKCCFETDRDVPDAMIASFGSAAGEFISDDGNGKFHVSLSDLCALSLLEAGVPDKNITLSGICTCCENDTYWSHRATGGVRGTMAAIIMLKGEN